MNLAEALPANERPLALTVKKTCDMIGLGPTSVYALIKSGRIRTKKIGRRTLVLYSSLEELLRA